ncbi:hypothetical protein K4I02_0236 [Streptococcus gordonii]|nr:hypothetical protein [Streptococcus gordonii]
MEASLKKLYPYKCKGKGKKVSLDKSKCYKGGPL